MHEALNAYRVRNGLSELLYSDSLETAADAHARDMYQRDFFSHENPDGETPLDRAVAAGFCQPMLVGENIAWGQGALTTVPEVQTGWENSPDHNANMLESDYAFAGMGHYVSPASGRYWVQVFGTPQY